MSWFREILALLPPVTFASVKRSAIEQSRVDRLANGLTLYTLSTCPYSAKVHRHLKQLNISIGIKNLKRCNAYQKELLAGGGRAQVPCLRIESNSGSRWLYESQDILTYIDSKFTPKKQIKRLEQA
ncbi:MAG: glutaredoxin [Bermanella sp.]